MTATIQEFLKSVKTSVSKATSSHEKFHIILGNEACDLDSAACSIALAYYLHVTKDKDKDNTIYLPILNITKDEYRLKTEVKYVLSKILIEEELLVFRGELNLKSLCNNNRLKISLVDFNLFSKDQEHLDKCVVRIIDHHTRKKKVSPKVQVTIETIGSCASLVTDFMLQNKDFQFPHDVALLLLGAILIDTACLGSKDKTTEKDIRMAEKLQEALKDIDKRDYYGHIFEAKLDDRELSQVEILLRDLKVIRKHQWNKSITIAVPVIYKSIFDFFKNGYVNENTFKELLELKRADVLVMMFLQVLGDTALRYLALYSKNEKLLNQVTAVLKEHKDPPLKLEKIVVIVSSPAGSKKDTDGAESRMTSNISYPTVKKTLSMQTFSSSLSTNVTSMPFYAFKQLNSAASRKVILPLLDNHLDDFIKSI